MKTNTSPGVVQNKRIVEVGTFDVPSGMIIVSDPCYDANEPIKAMAGKWVGVVVNRICDYFSSGREHERTCMLLAFHESMRGKEKAFISNRIPKGVQSRTPGFLGVDSGQMSVFDYDSYSGNLYDECCEKSTINGGIVDGHGVVSSTGIGDGGYRMSVWENDGRAVAVTIKFLPF